MPIRSALRPASLLGAATAMLLGALLIASGCADDRVQGYEEPPPPPPRCGDGTVNGEEQCEGDDLAGATCQSLGFVAGTLSCASDCRYDTSRCVRTCGNGRIDFGEECDGDDHGGRVCGDWGSYRCGPDCRLDQTGCVETLLREEQRLPFLNLSLAGFGSRRQGPLNTIELWASQPRHIDLIPWNGDLLFDEQRKRLLSLEGGELAGPITVADLNGDGQSDGLIRLQGMGGLTVAASTADGFAKSLVDLACEPLTPFLADLDQDGDLDAVVPTCLADGDAAEVRVLVNQSGSAGPLLAQAEALVLDEPARHFALADVDGDGHLDLLAHLPSKKAIALWKGDGALGFGTASSVTLAEGEVEGEFAPLDADGDGDLDLLVLDADGKELALLLNQGQGAFVRRPAVTGLSGARALTVLDLDLDGRLDVAMVDDVHLMVVQNVDGAFDQRRASYPLGAFVALNLAIGDADQDGDLELAVGGRIAGSTRGEVIVFRNLIR